MENFDELAKSWDDEPRRLERAKIVAEEMIRSIPDIQKKSGFEYGCGTGLLSLNLQRSFSNITLADSSEGMLSVLNRKIDSQQIANMKTSKIDLLTDPIPGEKFDVVYTLLTLHHIPDTDKIIRAFYDILNPSGYLCIADLDKEDGSFHGSDFDGHNGYDQVDLSDILMNCGFADVRSRICYVVKKKDANGMERSYPLFLMVAQKGSLY